ncbi:type III pantothenate kinase [Thalassotalea sp. 1_MG-2023]|uniref:type III pantothenate kinase n=1 Tax=Thalassotalea sp. 1_MG-2023 TaxID=3062680 RepID=UPI0026E249C0|nr:type III pantothenate kinase [Thalassotalea sp. 1_MG-2023]MDO6425651.1 type III pantothenate kinase [Thalassotalea sp. 1_MG-2023]
MKLLVDAGNTRIKYATLDAGILSSIHTASVDGLTQQLSKSAATKTTQCFIASVKKSTILSNVIAWCKNQNIPVHQLHSAVQFKGLVNSYQKPDTLGVDRWLAMLGAMKLFPSTSLMVVDAGTATTLDCISQQGKHLGGWIIPGIALQMSTLFDNAEKIHGEPVAINNIALGNNTSMAVSQGALMSTLGLIEQGMKLCAKQGLTPNIILTGGNADYVSQHLALEHYVEPALIFHGMSQYC